MSSAEGAGRAGYLSRRPPATQHPAPRGGKVEMGGLRTAFAALAGHGPRARLAERAAAQLGQRLSADCVVMSRYAPRDDSSDVVPLVVLGPHGVLVVEPRDDDGALACYQDHWYRRTAPGVSHPLSDSPSKRAQPDDVGSSCVPVIAGMDALVRHLEEHPLRDASIEHTHALAGALSGPI